MAATTICVVAGRDATPEYPPLQPVGPANRTIAHVANRP
jgi:hypothetical protein